MNVLEIKNINKQFADKVVLNNINLSIKAGEIFGLIGLNGMGKTTLIKIILNLLDADSGDCFICGENTLNASSRKNVFYLPEKFMPAQSLKPMEFFNIFTDLKEINKNAVEELCDKLALDKSALNKKIGQMSKGMTQKIGLIASILENKKLIILDEPMSGLDPKARICLKKVLLEYKDKGNSVFFSSHILSDLDEICDRVAILNNAKIAFVDTPNTLKAKYNEQSLEKAFLKEIQ